MAGGIAVGQGKDNKRSAVFSCIFRDSKKMRVGDFTRIQVQVGLMPFGYGEGDVFKASLLAEEYELVGLPCIESDRKRFKVVDGRNRNIESDRHER
jgi:hypothetical protein